MASNGDDSHHTRRAFPSEVSSEGDEELEQRAREHLRKRNSNAQSSFNSSTRSMIPDHLQDADEKVAPKVYKSFTSALLNTRTDDEHGRREGRLETFRIYMFGNIDDTKSRKPEMTALIHPSSYFARSVLFISSTLLMYTALVVPVILAFEWDKEESCEAKRPLLNFDLFVDTFFIFEIGATFFTGMYLKGKLIDNYTDVAYLYLKGAFWFDLITSIPVSYLELWAFLECRAVEDGEVNDDVGKWKIARLIKPIRVIRMIRVIRAMKNVDVSSQIERLFNLPPMFFRLFRVLFTITSVTHLASCTFWLTKVLSNNAEDVAEFLSQYNIEANAGITQKYILCTYFLISIFTTVGFGDVSASNSWEQCVVIIFMLVGVLVFGTLLSEVQSGVMELRKLARDKGLVLQQLKNFLRLVEVPQIQETKMLNWVDFEYSVHQENMEKSKAMEHLTGSMQLEVQSQIIGDCLANVDLLNLEHPHSTEMHSVLWAGAVSLTFQEGETIMHQNEVLNSMLIIHKGSVRVETLNGDTVVMLVKGDAIGEWALMEETPVKNLFGFPVVLIAHTHTQCCAISKRLFDSVLSQFPEEMTEELQVKLDSHHHLVDEMGKDNLSRANMLAMARWFSLVKKMLRKHKVSRRRASDTTAAKPSFVKKRYGRALHGSNGNSPVPNVQTGNPPDSPAPTNSKSPKAHHSKSPRNSVSSSHPLQAAKESMSGSFVNRFFGETVEEPAASYGLEAPLRVKGQYLAQHTEDDLHTQSAEDEDNAPLVDAAPRGSAIEMMLAQSEGHIGRGGRGELGYASPGEGRAVADPHARGQMTRVQTQVARVESRISQVEGSVQRVEQSVDGLRQDMATMLEAINSIQQTVGAPVAHMQAWGHREYLVDRKPPRKGATSNVESVSSRKVHAPHMSRSFQGGGSDDHEFGRAKSAYPAVGLAAETTFSMRGRNMGKAKMYSSSLRNVRGFVDHRTYEAQRKLEALKDAEIERASSQGAHTALRAVPEHVPRNAAAKRDKESAAPGMAMAAPVPPLAEVSPAVMPMAHAAGGSSTRQNHSADDEADEDGAERTASEVAVGEVWVQDYKAQGFA